MSDGKKGSDPFSDLHAPRILAFIGLGKMGTPMAARLLEAGYQVRAFDTAHSARARFAQACSSAVICSSAVEVVETAHAVITMLPNGKIVHDVLLGSGGAVRGMAPGTIVIDMSSSSPVDTQATGAALEKRNIDLIDAPVSGGVKRAVDGSLAILAGGSPALIQRCTPVLRAMGASIFPTGPLGSGHAMNALNNYVSAAGLVAASEALLIGRRYGLDPALMVDAFNSSTAKNNSTENKLKQYILSQTFGSGFAMSLMAKDLKTAADLAAHLGVQAPFAEACVRLWQEASAKLGDAADHTEIFRYLEDHV